MDASGQIEFMLNNTKKCLFRKIKRAVSEQIREDTSLLSSKQDKLKNMLAAEECSLYEEIAIYRERTKSAMIEMKRINALKMECAAEGRRRMEAQDKLEELNRENSESLRIQASIQKQIEAVAGMKYQIEQKRENYSREKELEAVWKEVMDHYYKMKLEDEEAKEHERQLLKKSYKSVLLEQISERDFIKMKQFQEAIEEAKKLKDSAIEFEREEKEKLQKQITQKLDLAKNKYEDLIKFRDQREKQKIYEKQFMQAYLTNQLEGIENEGMEADRKKFASQLEMRLHLAEVNKLKDAIQKMELLEDELRKKEQCLIERKHQGNVINESIRKEKIEQEIMKMRMVQISEKSSVPNDY